MPSDNGKVAETTQRINVSSIPGWAFLSPEERVAAVQRRSAIAQIARGLAESCRAEALAREEEDAADANPMLLSLAVAARTLAHHRAQPASALPALPRPALPAPPKSSSSPAIPVTVTPVSVTPVTVTPVREGPGRPQRRTRRAA